MNAFPEQVRIVEVGPRDGLQNESLNLTPKVRAQLVCDLARCGFTTIEAGSFVSPKWVPQMAKTDEVLEIVNRQFSQSDLEKPPSLPVLVANEKGLDAAIAADAGDIAIFAAASETFSQKNINCSIAQSLQRFQGIAKRALSHGMRVRGYVSCVMGCPYEGFIEPNRVLGISQALESMGCYEISLGDTIGVGSPNKTRALLKLHQDKLACSRIAVHFHDTYGQALANIHAALQCGIDVIDASVAGLGGCPYARGASGNVATEDVVYLLQNSGVECGINLRALVQVGRDICRRLDRPVMSKANLAHAG